LLADQDALRHGLGFPLIHVRFQHVGSSQKFIQCWQWQAGHLPAQSVAHPLHHRAVNGLFEGRLGDGPTQIADRPFGVFQIAGMFHPEDCRHHPLQPVEIFRTEPPLIEQPEFQPCLKRRLLHLSRVSWTSG
jgi:hypothetical protein